MAKVWVPHVLFAFGGSLNSTTPPAVEQWQSTYKCVWIPTGLFDPAVAPQNLTDQACLGLNAAHKNFIQITGAGTAGAFSNQCKLEYLKINAIGTDGKYAHPLTSQFLYGASPGLGSNSTTTRMYWRNSFVMSTRATTITRGRGAYGRTYLPPAGCITNTSETAPYAPAALGTSLVTQFKTLLAAVLAYSPTGGGQLIPAHIGAGDTVKGTSAVWTSVTSIMCNNIPMTQRTRTNKLAPLWSSIAFP